MKKIYNVSYRTVSDKIEDIEIIRESLNFLNGLADNELLEYVSISDTMEYSIF